MPRVVGCHRPEGVFVATGPGIAQAVALHEFSIMDLMPTILHYLGLPVPADCDGEVQRDVFRAGSEPALRPVAFYTPEPLLRLASAESRTDDDLVTRLRGLGYID